MTRGLVVAAAVAALLAPDSASAHGGYAVVDAKGRAYSVLVLASPSTVGGHSAVDLTAYPTRQDIGEPDLDARVTLRLHGPDGTRILHPRVVGDGYEALIPGRSDAWRRWRVTATVTGRAGRTTVTGGPVDAGDAAPRWLFPVSAALVVLAAATAIARVRRRPRAPHEAQA